MDTEIQTLPDDVDELKRLLRESHAANATLRASISATTSTLRTTRKELEAEQVENERLRERLRLYLQKRFGPSSEKTTDDQLQIFNEAEALADLDTESDEANEANETAEGTAPAPRQKKGRRPLPSWLNRREVLHDLADDEKICPHDGHALKCIGEEVSEQLNYIPATVEVIRNIRRKYACPHCEEGVRIAPLPRQPIPKSMAAPGLLAQIAISKYGDALPLYRQATIFERVGIELSRTTMANWMIAVGRLVQPVLNLLRDEMISGEIIQCDETRCQVLKEPNRAPQTQSYLWAQRGGTAEHPIVLFDYDSSRGSDVPKRLFADYAGYLQTDGYKGYDAISLEPGIVRVGCWAHARRKFDEAIKAQAGGKKSAKAKGASKAHQGFAFIQKLYRIEKDVRGQSAEVRHAARQREALPILHEMKVWLDSTVAKVPPKSLTGQAIAYTLGQWAALQRYVDDGRLEIDNNGVENAIRPFVLGRKNWMFSDTVHGAEASANLYSLIETAKANRLEPYRYLCHLLAELPRATTMEQLEALLPTRWIPDDPAKVGV